MSHQQVVDFRDSRIAHGGLHAVGVASVIAGPARIDQKRGASRRDKQGALSPFNVNRINAQGIRCVRLGRQLRWRVNGDQQQGEQSDEASGDQAFPGTDGVVNGNSHLRSSVPCGPQGAKAAFSVVRSASTVQLSKEYLK